MMENQISKAKILDLYNKVKNKEIDIQILDVEILEKINIMLKVEIEVLNNKAKEYNERVKKLK